MSFPGITGTEVSAALADLRGRTPGAATTEIEYATSRVWAARSFAAYELACDLAEGYGADRREALDWIVCAVGFASEAIEHGASASGAWSDQLRVQLTAAHERALVTLRRVGG
jgi:hypothetical protein